MDFLNSNSMIAIFLIASIGYVLGSVKVKGISLGTAGILIVALVFGHLGAEIPPIVQNVGLACFVTSVGFIAGPKFFSNFKGNAIAYIIIGVVIIVTGILSCLAIILFTGVDVELALGLLAGALTTTPGLAAAIDATGSNVVSIGYGIAYPFGVISVVLFMQLVPIILRSDIEKERDKFLAANLVEREVNQFKLYSCDSRGFFGFGLAIVLGILIGKITIPLPGGAGFSLGMSGGPLLMGLALGHFGRIWKLDVSVKKEVLVTMREFGLAMFLIGAGTNAGSGFVQVLVEQGFVLFLYGAVMALLPMLVGYFVAVKVFKFSLFNTLGTVCGGMTSTPALGTLIQVAGTDDVASAYAATYPVALAMIVLMIQFVGVYLG